ncbi:MAG: hypothetical protein K8R67_02600 [Desulfobacteraceae bacterium]|nr:hypothetical protein [Desulfobacteraceae bacterium]
MIDEGYYDYVSYVFSIGVLLLIVMPNLKQFSFMGIKAMGEVIDDRNIINILDVDGPNKIIDDADIINILDVDGPNKIIDDTDNIQIILATTE